MKSFSKFERQHNTSPLAKNAKYMITTNSKALPNLSIRVKNTNSESIMKNIHKFSEDQIKIKDKGRNLKNFKTIHEFFPTKPALSKTDRNSPRTKDSKYIIKKFCNNLETTSNKIMLLLSAFSTNENHTKTSSPIARKHAFSQLGNYVKKPKYLETAFPSQSAKLSDFVIVSTLGSGYFAEVKLTKWKTKYNLPCALKIVSKKTAEKLNQYEHLTNERNLLTTLNHPFIVKWYFLTCDKFLLKVMKVLRIAKIYILRLNIYQVVKFITLLGFFECVISSYRKSLKSDYNAIKFYSAEVGSAIEFLHSKNIAYRDLKSENILIDEHGHARLTDLGFAKELIKNRTMTMCGTPGYLAPEQLEKKGILV